jgi:hypothetical protein
MRVNNRTLRLGFTVTCLVVVCSTLLGTPASATSSAQFIGGLDSDIETRLKTLFKLPDFSARLRVSSGGKEHDVKSFFAKKGTSIRFETQSERGEKRIWLFRENDRFELDPQRKVYWAPAGLETFNAKDELFGYLFGTLFIADLRKANAESSPLFAPAERRLGTKTISGYVCDGFEFRDREAKGALFQARNLGDTIIRIETTTSSSRSWMQLVDISTKLEESLFQIPPGYVKQS